MFLSFTGIVYVRDTTRGGLCYYPVFNNGISGAFCRTEAGQTAAIIFLFVNTLVYLIGALVCLKLWRHEAARRYRERYGQEVGSVWPFSKNEFQIQITLQTFSYSDFIATKPVCRK